MKIYPISLVLRNIRCETTGDAPVRLTKQNKKKKNVINEVFVRMQSSCTQLLHIDDGKANWCSCSRKQFGSFLQS